MSIFQLERDTSALLHHRNTPCAITGLSPAQILFGRVLRDFLPLQPGKFLPRQEWRQAAETRAIAYSKRIMDKAVHLSQHTRALPRLTMGQQVLIQDQDKASRTYKQWNRTGIIIETGSYDDYKIRIDGSRNVTKRNRQFLKPVHLAPDTFAPEENSQGQHVVRDSLTPTPFVHPVLDTMPAPAPTRDIYSTKMPGQGGW